MRFPFLLVDSTTLKYYFVFFCLTMESITIKVDPAFARQMDKAMKPLYSTKTEFIRAAIREKIERQKETENLLRVIDENFGKVKRQTSPEEEDRIRERVGRELMRRHGIK